MELHHLLEAGEVVTSLRPVAATQRPGALYPPESKFLKNGYVAPCGTMRADQMRCSECGEIANSESVDVGVGLYIKGDYTCRCGWEYDADGKMNVAAYADYFVE